MNSKNRVALVTGASRGLGAAIALALAHDGVRVAINYFASQSKADDLVKTIRKAGGTAEAFAGDVRDEAQVTRLVSEVSNSLGPIEILVINATGPQPMLPIEETDWQTCLDQLEFFVKSPLLLAKAVVGGMKSRKSGRIIQVGSEVFESGPGNFSSYVSAKGAQLGLTRSWARELGPWGITVNLVAPGWIPTERHGDVSAESTREYSSSIPLKRMGRPQEVGETVAFLASDAAAFITGQRIAVNGGRTVE
jgi:3-oxoacyl-[acyl-carrier protein] reductase